MIEQYINELLGVEFIKVRNTIQTCQNTDQLRSAWNMIEIYRMKNPDLKHQYDLLLGYYVAKKDEFNPVKTNQEVPVI